MQFFLNTNDLLSRKINYNDEQRKLSRIVEKFFFLGAALHSLAMLASSNPPPHPQLFIPWRYPVWFSWEPDPPGAVRPLFPSKVTENCPWRTPQPPLGLAYRVEQPRLSFLPCPISVQTWEFSAAVRMRDAGFISSLFFYVFFFGFFGRGAGGQ